MTQKYLILVNFLVPLILPLLVQELGSATRVLTGVIGIPTTLSLFNLWLYSKGIELSWVKCCIFMFLGLISAQVVYYLFWGLTTKNLFRPDAETVAINLMLAKYYAGFVAILFLLIQTGKFIAHLLRWK